MAGGGGKKEEEEEDQWKGWRALDGMELAGGGWEGGLGLGGGGFLGVDEGKESGRGLGLGWEGGLGLGKGLGLHLARK